MENSINKPLISVVMPAYNAEKYIRQGIDSILNQTYSNIELLIADDASKDSTKKIIDSYTDKRIKTFHNDKNLGYLKTCNKLFAFAKGDFIAFQDADDLSVPNRLESQIEAFKSDNKLGAVGCNMTAIDTQNNQMFSTHYHLTHEAILKEIPDYFTVIPNSYLFKIDVYKKIGGYNEYFNRMGAEDYYWTYLIMEKYKLVNLREPLYLYRYNPVSITGDRSDNPKKMFSYRIVGFLINQRKKTGTDDLEKGDHSELNKFLYNLEKPFLDDPSLFYRKLASKYFHEGLKGRALKLIFKAILKNPYKIHNFKDFNYFIKNMITNYLKKILLIPINKYYKQFPDKWRIADWKKKGMPSPPPHVIKFKNILYFKKKFKATVFIETGTFLGGMDFRIRNLFKKIYSIELDEKLCKNAQERFSSLKHITIIQGDSGIVLSEILDKVNTNVLFWLDGHYSMGITARGDNTTPIEKELLIISKHMINKGLKHIILIDDARLFNGTDDYPTLNQIEKIKNKLFPNYKYEIRYDAIVLTPKKR